MEKRDHKSLLDTRKEPKTATAPVDVIDDTLVAIGGVGMYQIKWFIIVVAGMLAGAPINYSLYYFTIQPIYLCLEGKKWSECVQADICNMDTNELKTDVTYKIDFDDNRSLLNWNQ